MWMCSLHSAQSIPLATHCHMRKNRPASTPRTHPSRDQQQFWCSTCITFIYNKFNRLIRTTAYDTTAKVMFWSEYAHDSRIKRAKRTNEWKKKPSIPNMTLAFHTFCSLVANVFFFVSQFYVHFVLKCSKIAHRFFSRRLSQLHSVLPSVLIVLLRKTFFMSRKKNMIFGQTSNWNALFCRCQQFLSVFLILPMCPFAWQIARKMWISLLASNRLSNAF